MFRGAYIDVATRPPPVYAGRHMQPLPHVPCAHCLPPSLVSACARPMRYIKLPKDMMDIARHIVEQKSGHFRPDKFEDHYETALRELLRKKEAGEKIVPAQAPATSQGRQPHGRARRSLDVERKGPQNSHPPLGGEPASSAKKPRGRASHNRRKWLIPLPQVRLYVVAGALARIVSFDDVPIACRLVTSGEPKQSFKRNMPVETGDCSETQIH